jgi:hypothetical protein
MSSAYRSQQIQFPWYCDEITTTSKNDDRKPLLTRFLLSRIMNTPLRNLDPFLSRCSAFFFGSRVAPPPRDDECCCRFPQKSIACFYFSYI